ncbi:MAG: hypothetical protein J4G04_08175 [Nitrosopumilaceae archaeon]|nr:hypothetical protein [Nitrosopumilaceae archaeon]
MKITNCATGHLCTIIPIIAFVAAASTYLDAYGEENCFGSYKIVSFKAPERVGAPTATGTACMWYANGSESLRKPVIIMDGFDPGDVRDHAGIRQVVGEDVLSMLQSEGYDLVVLNFDIGAGYIQDDAHILRELIKWTGEEAEEDAVVIGASLGGVISRYALAQMENFGEEHNTRLFISFDAPYLGAVVPLGNQYFIKYASELNLLLKYYMESHLYSVAAKQIVLYHEAHSPGTAGRMDTAYNETIYINGPQPDPLFKEFRAELDGIGWPKNLRMVAISSGDGYGMSQGFEEGSQLIEYELDSPLLNITENTYAIRGGEAGYIIFEGKIDPAGLPDHRFKVYVKNAIPYDNAPGGWKATSKLIEGDAGCLHIDNQCAIDLGHITANVEHENYVPTHSALGIDLSRLDNDPFADINAAYMNDTSITPFDKIYYPRGNQEHVLITPENEKWFLCEIFADSPKAYARHCSDDATTKTEQP